MRKTFLLILFVCLAVQAKAAVNDIKPIDMTFNANGTVRSLEFSVEDSTHGPVNFSLTSADVSLARTGTTTGDFSNKTAIKTAAKNKYLSIIAAKAAAATARTTAVNNYNTFKTGLSLPIVRSDLE